MVQTGLVVVTSLCAVGEQRDAGLRCCDCCRMRTALLGKAARWLLSPRCARTWKALRRRTARRQAVEPAPFYPPLSPLAVRAPADGRGHLHCTCTTTTCSLATVARLPAALLFKAETSHRSSNVWILSIARCNAHIMRSGWDWKNISPYRYL